MNKLETKGFKGLMEMAQEKAKSKECWGEEFNASETSDYYKIVAPFITVASYLEDKIISLMKGLNLYNAQGNELDDLLDRFSRRQGSYAFVNCEITANSYISVNEKDILVETSNGIQFENIQQFDIDASKKKTILFKALLTGEEGNIKPSSITKVLSAPGGIINVQNIAEGEGGLTQENDYDYLNRYLAGNTEGEWALEPVIAAVRALAGVKSCNGIRNNTMKTDNNGLEPKSIWLVVDGGIKEEIAEAIYKHIHTPDTKGSVSVEVPTSVSGKTETIRFDRPIDVVVDYQLIIESSDEVAIKKLLKEYINNAGLGVKLSTGVFISDWVCGKGYKYYDFDLKFKKSTEVEYKTSLQLAFNERSKARE